MRKLLLPFLLLPLLLAAAQAQLWGPVPLGTASGGGGGGGGYAGPGDVVSGAAGAYSCGAAYSVAYAAGTGGLCDLQRSSDSATCTIKAATSGTADLTGTYCSGATVSSFCGASGGHCLVVDFIDQSGNSRTMISTFAGTSYPLLVFNYTNSLPCVQFASSAWAATAVFSMPNTSQPQTMSIVTLTAGTGAGTPPNYMTARDNGGNVGPSIYAPTSTTVAAYAGNELGPVTVTAALHAVLAVYDGTSSVLNVDGAETTGDVGTQVTATEVSLSSDVVGTSGTFGDQTVCEALIYFSGFSSGQRSSMNSNQHSRWGF